MIEAFVIYDFFYCSDPPRADLSAYGGRRILLRKPLVILSPPRAEKDSPWDECHPEVPRRIPLGIGYLVP